MSLRISDLHASVEGHPILQGVSLDVPKGEIHAIMGPNGSGKSTLAYVLAGHPSYKVESGSAQLATQELLDLEPEERAQAGLFLAFQYPASIPGVSVAQFLHLASSAVSKAHGKQAPSFTEFLKELKVAMRTLKLAWSFAERSVNDGFSGGEKKRVEILQMLMLKPRLVVLDEIDSGLDVDAMRIVASGINLLHEQEPTTTFLVITHYQRLLQYVIPDRIHVMQNGRITKSGTRQLAETIEASGYEPDSNSHHVD